MPDQSYDSRVTDMSSPLITPGPALGGVLDNFKNRNIRNTAAIQLQANVALRVLGQNFRRTGLLIQNKDSAATLFIAYGNVADINSLGLPPGGFILEDFTTPKDEVWLFATANIQATVVETMRGF
jgi:hypothetical protein